MKKKMKAIEPLIAVIILIAVTVVIAIAVVGFIMGWWGTFGAVEQVRIYPDSKLRIINATTGIRAEIALHVKNEGTATAVIYKVEIEGVNATDTQVTLTPGQETTIPVTILIPQNITMTPGAMYKVSVYTRAGNVYSVILRAE